MWRGEAAELNPGSYSPALNGAGRPLRRAEHRTETSAGGGILSNSKGHVVRHKALESRGDPQLGVHPLAGSPPGITDHTEARSCSGTTGSS